MESAVVFVKWQMKIFNHGAWKWWAPTIVWAIKWSRRDLGVDQNKCFNKFSRYLKSAEWETKMSLTRTGWDGLDRIFLPCWCWGAAHLQMGCSAAHLCHLFTFSARDVDFCTALFRSLSDGLRPFCSLFWCYCHYCSFLCRKKWSSHFRPSKTIQKILGNLLWICFVSWDKCLRQQTTVQSGEIYH